jgi:hypothetical protein
MKTLKLFLVILFLASHLSKPYAQKKADLSIYYDGFESKPEAKRIIYKFIQNQLIPGLGPEIRSRVYDKNIFFELTKDRHAHGIFWDPLKKQGRLTIAINESLLESADLKRVVAHEFFHLVHFLVNPNEEAWIREGLALLYEYEVLNEYNANAREAALLDSTTPLIGDYNIKNISNEQYGHNFLFFYFLKNKCQKKNLLWELALGFQDKKGQDLVDFILANTPCKNFKNAALIFEIARAHNRVVYLTQDSEMDTRFSLDPQRDFKMRTQNVVREDQIKKLKTYQPLLLSHAAYAGLGKDSETLKNLTIVFIRMTFPYTVQDSEPKENLIEWNVILIRTL